MKAAVINENGGVRPDRHHPLTALCWESGYPHSHTNWPFALKDVIESMGADDLLRPPAAGVRPLPGSIRQSGRSSSRKPTFSFT
jgi:hypothetical protein